LTRDDERLDLIRVDNQVATKPSLFFSLSRNHVELHDVVVEGVQCRASAQSDIDHVSLQLKEGAARRTVDVDRTPDRSVFRLPVDPSKLSA